MLPRASTSLLAPLFDPLIQRLQNPRVHGRNHIYRRIQLFLGHARFPCVRKAPLHSRITKPHHGDRETDQYLLPLSEALHRMGLVVKCTKISFLQSCSSLMPEYVYYGPVSRLCPNEIEDHHWNSIIRLRAENTKAFASGGIAQILVKRHELKSRRIVLGGENRRTDLQGIGSS